MTNRLTRHERNLRSQIDVIDENENSRENTSENNELFINTISDTQFEENLTANEIQHENNFSSEFEKKLQIEYQRLEIAKRKILLKQNVTSFQMKESTKFQSIITLSHYFKIVFNYVLNEAAQRRKDAMMLKKNYIVTNSTLYISKSLKEFEIFKLTCMNIFDVKLIIYEKSIAKIQYARNRLKSDFKIH